MSKHLKSGLRLRTSRLPPIGMRFLSNFIWLRVLVLAILLPNVLLLTGARAGVLDDRRIYAQSGPIALGGMLQGSPVWEAYRNRFVAASGRVVDTGNGASSHSEGQGYGLLLAAAAGDRDAFDRILAWTRVNLLVRRDSLAAWRWTEAAPAQQDKHNATDGDILIAWALAEAADYWDDPAYLELARSITRSIASKLVVETRGYGTVLLPSASGFSAKDRPDGLVVNLSYWIFPAFSRFAQLEPDFDWNALMQSGLDLIGRAQFGGARMPPDWLAIEKQDQISPAQGFEALYGYNAVRIPIYLVWADALTPKRLRIFDDAWPRGAAFVSLQGGQNKETALGEPGYQAIAALLRCASKSLPYPESFYRFTQYQNYYPATLHVLSLMAATLRGGACLDSARISALVSPTWRPRIGSLQNLETTAEEAPLVENPNVAAYASDRFLAAAYEPVSGIHKIPEETDLLSYLRIVAGACTVLAGLYYLLSRAGDEDGERQHDDPAAPTASAWRPEPGQYAIVPRTLASNPFSGTNSPQVLGAEIEAAAEASVRHSRTVGLVYFEFPALVAFEKTHGPQAAEALVQAVAGDFRRAVRATDHVAILNKNQIVVSISLLANRKDLETIASRLTAAARRREMIEEDAPSLPVGLAIYPLDGYGGLELIDAARHRFNELQPKPKLPVERHEAHRAEARPHAPTHHGKRSKRRPADKMHPPHRTAGAAPSP